MPPETLELRELRYFLAVAEELNFTRAAERLHLAQQALSSAVRKLEADLGVQLFTRSTRHVALTSAGEALVVGARHVLESAAEAVDEVHRVAGGRSGRLIIGFSTAIGSVPRVREIIRRFSQESPGIDLRLVEHDFSDPTAGLATNATQVAFVFGPLPTGDLTGLPVLEEPRLVALAATHPLAARTELSVAELSGLPWLRVPAADGPWRRFWFSHPLGETQTGPEIRTADEWVPVIESGRGVAYTLRSVMDNFPNTEIATVPVTGLEPGAILVAWRSEDADPTVTSFVASAKSTLGRP
ncbi:MAG TPA: LysR family transcriptional regulator [Candidatus Limnocylindria bacterium]